MPYHCLNPLATKQALYWSMEPLDFRLILYTHLQSIKLLPLARGTKCQVLLCMRAENSTSKDVFYLGSDRAAWRVEDSSEVAEFP
jgi:hypothetical protein